MEADACKEQDSRGRGVCYHHSYCLEKSERVYTHTRCVCRVIYKHVRRQKVELCFGEGRVILTPSGPYDETAAFAAPCFYEPSGNDCSVFVLRLLRE